MCPIFKVDGFCLKENCRFCDDNGDCIYQEMKDKKKEEFLKKKQERKDVVCEG